MKDDKSRVVPLLMDPRQPDENNRAYAYRILRKNIMNSQLQPGCQLSEAELSEHLVMSRTPIHEALMMLKGEWLVDVLPQRGSIVSKISITSTRAMPCARCWNPLCCAACPAT